MPQKIERSFFLFKVFYQFFFALSFPTYVLFLKDGGLDASQVGWVNALFMLAVCLFEVPTGVIGDRFGRKQSVIIGLFVCSLGFFSYFLSQSFGAYVLSEIIIAFGCSFISGSLQAWLKDSLDHYQGRQKFGVVWSNGEKFAHLAGIVGGVSGSLLAIISLSLPWLVAGIGTLLFAFCCFSLIDESYFQHTKLTWRESWVEAGRLFTRGFKLVASRKELKYFFSISCLTAFALQPMNQQWSLYFSENFGLKQLTFIWLGISFSLFLGSHTASRILKQDKFSEITLLLVVQLLTSLFILLMAQQGHPAFVLLFFLGHEIPRGSWGSLQESYLQQHITSDVRATMGSISSLITRLGAGAGWLLAGLLLEQIPILNCWLLSGIALLATVPFFWLLARQR